MRESRNAAQRKSSRRGCKPGLNVKKKGERANSRDNRGPWKRKGGRKKRINPGKKGGKGHAPAKKRRGKPLRDASDSIQRIERRNVSEGEGKKSAFHPGAVVEKKTTKEAEK